MDFRDVFPLAVSPFEEYLLRDERPGYPMTMPLLFMFRGNADVQALESAFHEAVLHEPLFCATSQQRNGSFYWTAASEPPHIIMETEAIADGVEQIVPLDITHQPGIHCRYIPTPEGFAIRLQIHHAICDGLGTILFLGNWMAEYARLVGDDAGLTVNHPLPERIKARTDLQIEHPHPLSRWTLIKSFMRQFYIWFGRSVHKISAHNVNHHAAQNRIENPVLLWRSISQADIVRLRQKARDWGVSLNSYLTGLYFQHLCQWLDASKESDRRWLRLLVPTNLRKPVHFDIPASNMIGYAFFDRRASECRDSQEFYQSIDNAIDRIKKWSMGAMFMSVLEIIRRIPFALPLILSSRNCLATSVFSNIGNPCKMLPHQRFRESGTIEVGGVKLYRIIGAPPIRPNTPFCVGVIQQSEETTISMIVDSSRLGLENCREFHESFIEKLLNTSHG
ncbi:MAG: hypothetical protein LBI05_10640 [Planctomycetaceae bacterium]|nr:hypothetical protein [Planctomycetaceae bacterium]